MCIIIGDLHQFIVHCLEIVIQKKLLPEIVSILERRIDQKNYLGKKVDYSHLSADSIAENRF